MIKSAIHFKHSVHCENTGQFEGICQISSSLYSFAMEICNQIPVLELGCLALSVITLYSKHCPGFTLLKTPIFQPCHLLQKFKHRGFTKAKERESAKTPQEKKKQ